MSIQRIRSKSAKTDALLADDSLAGFVPSTRSFGPVVVREMLDRYGMIYVKPVAGTYGNGVIRIEKNAAAANPYRFQSGFRKYAFATFEGMFAKLLRVKRNKPYLAQQGIDLLTYRGRKYDLRVMVQKNPLQRWETTGLIGRVAHPGKVVTNYHSGGTPMPADRLLGASLSAEQTADYETRLRKMGEKIAGTLERRYPRLKEIGVDIAVDVNHKPWILEVNTLPDPFLFRKLPDKKVFRRMYDYAVAYGRFGRRVRKR